MRIASCPRRALLGVVALGAVLVTTSAAAQGLTGDWGGARTDLIGKGLSINFDTTQYYQGLISGDGNESFD